MSACWACARPHAGERDSAADRRGRGHVRLEDTCSSTRRPSPCLKSGHGRIISVGERVFSASRSVMVGGTPNPIIRPRHALPSVAMSGRLPGRSHAREEPTSDARSTHHTQDPHLVHVRTPAAEVDRQRDVPKTRRPPVRSSARLARAHDPVVRGRLVGTSLSPGRPSRGGRQLPRPPGAAPVASSASGAAPTTAVVASPAGLAQVSIDDIVSARTEADCAAEIRTTGSTGPLVVADASASAAMAPLTAASVAAPAVAVHPGTELVSPVVALDPAAVIPAPVVTTAAAPRVDRAAFITAAATAAIAATTPGITTRTARVTPAAVSVAAVASADVGTAATPAPSGVVLRVPAVAAPVAAVKETASIVATDAGGVVCGAPDVVGTSSTACADGAAAAAALSDVSVGIARTITPPAVAMCTTSATAASSSTARAAPVAAGIQVAAATATRPPEHPVVLAAAAMGMGAQPKRATAPPSAESTWSPTASALARSALAVTPTGAAKAQTPVPEALPIAASSMTTPPASPCTGTGVERVRAGLPAAPPGFTPHGSSADPPPTPVARPPGAEDTARSTDWLPVPDGRGDCASVGDDTQLLAEDDPEKILPILDSGVRPIAPDRVEAGDGGLAPTPVGRALGTGTGDGLTASEVREVSESSTPATLGLASNPKDGVYTLNESTRARISTLLRTLFVVQQSSDKSIMPFLGIVHYLMGFSALVGVTSLQDRSDFFDALLVAFERPVSMKFFMEEAFQCGPQGLHVGGRTRPLRHVAGQPPGLQEDVLRARINKDNVKVQWIARRLSLRQRVSIHQGARSVTGGLSHTDRAMIVQSLAGDGVSSKLRERGCVVKYAKVGAVDRKPLSIAFQWDANSTWFPGGLEADLVSNLRDVLLKAAPVAYKDCDPHKPRASRPSARNDARKRPGTSDLVGESGRAEKRSKEDNQMVATRPPSRQPADDCCSKCGQAAIPSSRPSSQVVPTALEHWSADVCRSDDLPHGGHVLAIALPMDMDAGPGGRQSVKGVLAKISKTGAAPCSYSLFVSCGERVPDPDAVVQGAMFTSADGRHTANASMSHDILRSVSSHMSRRSAAGGASHSGSRPEGSSGTSRAVRLSVRAAAKPTLQTHRFDFTSEFELQTKGELVQRTPGRVIIFWPGIDPVPVGGAFIL